MISTNFYGTSLTESNSTMEDEDENMFKPTIVSSNEDDSRRESIAENCVTLNEYPRVTQRQYVINKVEQQKALWGDLLGSKSKISCKKKYRKETVQSLLFWLSYLLQFIALVLSFSKDTMNGKSILNMTILEILFAMLGVLTACYKQWQRLVFVVQLEDSEDLSDNRIIAKRSFHMSGFIITSNMVGCAMLFCGFILLLFFDRESYSFLKNMVYFTGITIFTLALMDNIIMTKLLESISVIEKDQMKLFLHEMKEELFQELQLDNKYERVKILRDYFQKFPIFQLKPKNYIYPV